MLSGERVNLRKYLHFITKTMSFFVFGVGSVLISILIGPLFFLIIHPKKRANDAVRKLVSASFRTFVNFMRFFFTISLKVENEEYLYKYNSTIVCANHPTLLDAVFLIGMVPRADCIVKSSHWKNPITKGVVSQIYLPNSLDAKNTITACKKSLDEGHNLILFPEGTRTKTDQTDIRFYRSAAQIALRTNYNILPVYIKVSSPSGLGKGDRYFSCPQKGKVEFEIHFREPIEVSDYMNLDLPLAARSLTDDMKDAIFYRGNHEQKIRK